MNYVVMVSILGLCIFLGVKKYNITVNSLLISEANFEKYKNIINSNNEMKKYRTTFFCCSIISFMLFLLIFFLGIKDYINPYIALAILLLLIYLAYFVLKKIYKNLKTIYRNAVCSIILADYDSNLNYFPTGGIKENDYRYAKFDRFIEFHSEDLIIGNINGLEFIFSDVATYDYNSVGDNDGGMTKNFNGSVAIIKFKYNFNSFMYLVEKGFFGVKTKYTHKINDSFITKKYRILSDSKNLVDSFFTTEVLVFLKDFYKKTGLSFEMKLYNDVIYFRFYTPDLFNPGLFGIGNINQSITIIDAAKELMTYITDKLQTLN